MDKYYTPDRLADHLISACDRQDIYNIVDFTAGDGSLLKAAARRWGDAQHVGMDLDWRALRKIAKALPSAELYHADFLGNQHSNRRSKKTLDAARRFDLILLNPPFSCRGNASLEVAIDGGVIRTSTAMAFVTRSLDWLACGGELLAIVPASCVTSQKDRRIRSYLETNWHFEVVEEGRSREFAGCAVTIAIIRVTRRSAPVLREVTNPAELRPPVDEIATIFRGNLSVAQAKNESGSCLFVHTTNLRDHKIVGACPRVGSIYRSVSGPAILIPRVGRPRVDKIVLKLTRKRIIISDCVIAIQLSTASGLQKLHEHLVSRWADICGLYSGTCAPYITVEAVTHLLRQLGYGLAGVDLRLGYPPCGDGATAASVVSGNIQRSELRDDAKRIVCHRAA